MHLCMVPRSHSLCHKELINISVQCCELSGSVQDRLVLKNFSSLRPERSG